MDRKVAKSSQSRITHRYKGSSRQEYKEWKKTKLKYECLKLLKKERKQNDMRSVAVPPTETDSDEETQHEKHRKAKKLKKEDSVPKKSHVFAKAQESFKVQKESREKEKKEHDHKMNEQRKALKKYQNKKKKRQMMLNKKTHKGQPIMKYQMDFLLEKIKSQTGKS